ncbi:MAG: tail fiber domain-containing protein [Bacteroidales bacterium]|nr:tail fiber domain-containing protein [Bacteroidales bacterium]
MKNLNTLMLIALFLTSTLAVRAQVAINQDGSTPDVTAMLDVKSTTKGMLIPRMSTTQRVGISSPANGLLVFDTDTKTFWYYDSSTTAWKEITSSVNNSINSLTDGRTAGNSVYLGSMAGADDDGNLRSNTAVGVQAMWKTSSGTQNVAMGRYALQLNDTGASNVALGYSCLAKNNGFGNVAVGNSVLIKDTSGSNNTAIGHWSGYNSKAGSGNVFIGYRSGFFETGSNKLYIENSMSNAPLIYGEFDNDLLTVYGRLGVGATATADTKLRVSHNDLYAANFTTDFGDANTIVINAEYTGTGVYDATAIYGKAAPDANSNYGFGGDFVGNYMGVRSNANAGSSSGAAYGVYGRSNGTAGTRYGVFGWAEGGSNRYGVYGKAFAQTNSYGIYCDGNGVYTGTWSQTSDKKLKKNIEPLQGALEKLLQLSPKTYEYRTAEYEFMNLAQGAQIGFVAQDVETVFPELVSTVSHPKSQGKSNDYEEYKAINYIALIPVLTEAIQEQQQQIEQQKQLIETLLERVKLLEKVKGTVK